MSGQNVAAIRQEHNIGVTNAINYGETNFTYINTVNGPVPKTPKQKAEEAHRDIKAAWENAETCGWLEKNSDFQTWIQMKNQHSFLWLHGIPGCGKSTLISRAIEHIRERPPQTVHLLYFYVSYGDSKQYRSMLMTFWEQTISKNDERSTDIFANSPVEKIQTELNERLAQAKRNVYIVIDAVDQLPQTDQHDLLEGLKALVRKHRDAENKSRLSIMISSRTNGCDELESHQLLRCHVSSHENKGDIEKYLDKRLKSALLDEDPELKKDVKEMLINKADGMFMWAKLQTANIRKMTLRRKVESALQNLTPPDGLNKIYEGYAKEFESLDREDQQIVLRTMALLAHTTGSMSKEILFVALALNVNDGKIDQSMHDDLKRHPDKIVQLCNNLVDINESLGVVQFCHKSVYEFFEKYKPVEGHKLIAQLCLTHLNSRDFERGPFEDAKWFNSGSLGYFLQKHPFLRFASCTWAASAKKSVEAPADVSVAQAHKEILGCFKKLFEKHRVNGKEKKKKNLQLSFQVYLITLGKTMPIGVRHEHIVSYFALHEFLDEFVRRRWLNPKKRDDEGSTTIHWAIRNETIEDEIDSATVVMVRKLIDHIGDEDVQDNDGRTPLHYASYFGKPHVLQLLLEKSNIDHKSEEKETPLIAACRSHRKVHHEVIIPELLRAGADVHIQSFFGTALQTVSLIGCESCTKSIFKKYKKRQLPFVESRGPFGTPLHAAAFYGHSSIVELLLGEKEDRKKDGKKVEKKAAKKDKKKTKEKKAKRKKSFDIYATNETYGSALTAAAIGCSMAMDPTPFETIFRTLIDHGVDVNDPSGTYGPALRAASSTGQKTLVELLWENGAEISLAKGPTGTAYQAAEEGGHEEIMRFLLEKDPKAAGYEMDTLNKKVFTKVTVLRESFERAISNSNMTMANNVIQFAEATLNVSMKLGKSPFLEAMTRECEQVFNYVVTVATEEASQSGLERANDLMEGDEKHEQAPKAPAHDDASKENKTQEALADTGFENTPKGQVSGAATSPKAKAPKTEAPDEELIELGRPHTVQSPEVPVARHKGQRVKSKGFFSSLCSKCCSEKEIDAQTIIGPRPCVPRPSIPQKQDIPESATIQRPGKSEFTHLQGQTVPENNVEQERPTPRPVYGCGDFVPGPSTEQGPSSKAVREQDLAASQMHFAFNSATTKTEPRPKLERRHSYISSSPRRMSTFEFVVRRRSLPGRSNSEAYCREVLNQLTRTAVNLLESAIWLHEKSEHANLEHADSNHARECRNLQVVRLFADTWVGALNNLVSHPGFGVQMLEIVVGQRADELKGHLENQKLSQKKRSRKAEGLARVGVELLMTSIRRGPQFKHLSRVLSRLWVSAVNRVLTLGERGEEVVAQFVRMFAEWFSTATKSRDEKNAETYAQGGFQLLWHAALSPEKKLMDKFVEEWVRQWKLAIDCFMGHVISKLINNGWADYHRCITDGRRDEALGLAVGGIGLLRAAIKQGIGEVVHECLPKIISGFSCIMYHHSIHSPLAPILETEIEALRHEEENQLEKVPSNQSRLKHGGMNADAIIEAVILLIDTAERRDPDRLSTLAPTILDCFENFLAQSQQVVSGLVHQRFKRIQKESSDPEREERLKQIATATMCLLNVQLCSCKARPNALTALKKLALAIPEIVKKDEFARYEKAIEYLKPPKSPDEVQKTLQEAGEEKNGGSGKPVRAEEQHVEAEERMGEMKGRKNHVEGRQDETGKAQDEMKEQNEADEAKSPPRQDGAEEKENGTGQKKDEGKDVQSEADDNQNGAGAKQRERSRTIERTRTF